MRREDSSTVLIVLFSLSIIIYVRHVQARTLLQVCSSSCGDIQNISYPFRLKGDPVRCGDPDYELSCENNRTIFDFHQGKYYVKQISYEKQIIRVVDVNLANGSCNLPYSSLSFDDVNNDFRYRGVVSHTYTNFVECSVIISDPEYIQVPCLSGNASHVYVIYGGSTVSSGLHGSCKFISTVPGDYLNVKNPSYGVIQKLLESGFDLGWSVKCRDCLVSGSSCVVRSWDLPFTYECERNGFSFSIDLSDLFPSVGSSILDLILIPRFIFAPLVILVFLLHKYQTTRKTVETVET